MTQEAMTEPETEPGPGPEPETETPRTVEELAAEVQRLEADLVQAGETMTKFKALVRTEAMRMAQQHNLCSVVEQTLHKVGIDNVRRRVEVVYTFRRRVAYEVPDELLTLVTEQQFLAYAHRGQLPQGRTNRDMRAVRLLQTEEEPVGSAEMTVSDPRNRTTVNNPMGLVMAPTNYLEAYASETSRVLHYLLIGDQSLEVQHLRYTEFAGQLAACGVTGHWRANSTRAYNPPRSCQRCQTAVAYLR